MIKWYYTEKLGLGSRTTFLVSDGNNTSFIVVGEDGAKKLVDTLNELERDSNAFLSLWHYACMWDKEEG